MHDLEQYLNVRIKRINQTLAYHLPPKEQTPSRLHKAMHYAVLNGGKRIRPLLTYVIGETLGATLSELDTPACAVEFVHNSSLIHDDLPAMDNDDFRRGQPTCHKAFDEATAILAGDALLNLGTQILTNQNNNISTANCHKLLRMISELTTAIGSAGLIGGQALEFETTNKNHSIKQLERIHNNKTGSLIRASVKLAAIAADASEQQITILDNYAKCLGLAFQIQDDILDIDEVEKNKFTYVSLLGLEGAKNRLNELKSKMDTSINALEVDCTIINAITNYVMQRKF